MSNVLEKKSFRVFVYGSLRRGQFNHGRFRGFPEGFQCEGFISNALLKSLGSYPAIVPSDNPETKVLGEIYDIDEDLHKIIERMEVGAGYELRPVTVSVLIAPEEFPDKYANVAASAYFFRDPARIAEVPAIEHGDWTKRADPTV